MQRKIIYSFILAVSLLLLTACGSDSKANAGDLPPSEQGLAAEISCTVADEETSPIIARCYVHTVDGNSDPVSGLTYEITLINDYRAKSFGETGNILTETPVRFTDYSQNFVQDGVKISDNLIVFPVANAYDPSYLGGWNIASVDYTSLTFRGDNFSYNLETTEGLSYVIGNASGISVQEASEDIDTDDTVRDLEGFYYFDLVYNHDLKDSVVYIGAHTTGNRVGTAVAMRLKIPDEDTTTP